MKVFISWSGEISHNIAKGLSELLRFVTKNVTPFLSSEDIMKGEIWFDKIGAELQETDFGILCITPTNRIAPWVLFEAGALSKRVSKSHVAPLLVGLKAADLTPPLSMFNSIAPTKSDIFKLVKAINERVVDGAHTEADLYRAFDKWWSDLESVLTKAEVAIKQGVEGAKAIPKRHTEDILEEILALSKGISRKLETDSKGRGVGFWTGSLTNPYGSATSQPTLGQLLEAPSELQIAFDDIRRDSERLRFALGQLNDAASSATAAKGRSTEETPKKTEPRKSGTNNPEFDK